MNILNLILVLTAADPDDGLAKKMQAIYAKDASKYSLAVESAPKKELELKKEPVFEWTNPVREKKLVQGVVFLWLRDGRPAALGGIFSHPAPRWKGHKVLHEFLALDRDKLVVSRPNGNNQWTPQAGLERNELSDAAAPAASRGARLLQMRRLAEEFTGHIIDYEGKRVDLRRLPTPLYRYPAAKTGVVDGALFALVTTEGTDPEVVLVLEAREKDGKTRWEYACGRFGVVSMYMQHKGKEVWSSILNGRSDTMWHDRLHLYSLYPEKIVTPEGKLLAGMRLTANEEEVVIRVDEK
jgi:hypothetical protein